MYFGLGDHPDTPSELQNVLTKAIEMLQPKENDPNPNQNKMVNELILFRNVQQFSQNDVAKQIGVRVRQFRRDQNSAIYKLAIYFWQKYDLTNNF